MSNSTINNAICNNNEVNTINYEESNMTYNTNQHVQYIFGSRYNEKGTLKLRQDVKNYLLNRGVGSTMDYTKFDIVNDMIDHVPSNELLASTGNRIGVAYGLLCDYTSGLIETVYNRNTSAAELELVAN